jgi:hypothetical protein
MPGFAMTARTVPVMTAAAGDWPGATGGPEWQWSVRPGQCLHVDAVAREEGPAGLPESVQCGWPGGRGASELPL